MQTIPEDIFNIYKATEDAHLTYIHEMKNCKTELQALYKLAAYTLHLEEIYKRLVLEHNKRTREERGHE